jgi:hypothetical protein
MEARMAGEQKDPAIEKLNLAETARKAAYALKAAHPGVTFTSGRRDRADQCRAMAQNVAGERGWIAATYKPGPVAEALQRWVNAHPEAATVQDLAVGLLGAMNALPDAVVAGFSKHLTGEAFDVQPLPDGPQATAIKTTIRGLPGLVQFLEKEGTKIRWHAGF